LKISELENKKITFSNGSAAIEDVEKVKKKNERVTEKERNDEREEKEAELAVVLLMQRNTTKKQLEVQEKSWENMTRVLVAAVNQVGQWISDRIEKKIHLPVPLVLQRLFLRLQLVKTVTDAKQYFSKSRPDMNASITRLQTESEKFKNCILEEPKEVNKAFVASLLEPLANEGLYIID